MLIRRFFMEDWLASYKDSCPCNLGESGMPDISVGELLKRCGSSPDILNGIVLRDHDTRGTERLRQAISASYGGDVPFEHITVTTGTSEALFVLFNILLAERSSAVVPFPSFQALYEVPRALGAELRMYCLTADKGFRPDPDEICGLIDDTTGVVVINSPHNPSGVLVPEETVSAVAEKAAFHGTVVISDEHYRFLPHDAEPPLGTFASADGTVVATGSLTKCFGVIGLRVGWIVAPPPLIERVRDFRDYITHTLSPISDMLAALTLENTDVFIRPAIAALRRNRDRLHDTVAATPGLSLVGPEAGVVAFPRYDYDVLTDDFARGLIERYGVFVLPGSGFETERHFRVNLGCDPEMFTDAFDRIAGYCAGF